MIAPMVCIAVVLVAALLLWQLHEIWESLEEDTK